MDLAAGGLKLISNVDSAPLILFQNKAPNRFPCGIDIRKNDWIQQFQQILKRLELYATKSNMGKNDLLDKSKQNSVKSELSRTLLTAVNLLLQD